MVEINSPFEDEKRQIGIDFDGVIHACTKGYHDGTVYDDPVTGSLEAIKELSKNFTIIVYSAKARSDRPLIDNKTGVELIWAWLEKHGFKDYVEDVTSEKPRAICYIDDRAIRFVDWEQAYKELRHHGIVPNRI
tara:strand:+ start:717 stop:1118 length:402 start_codon:yes stop_codon:yes gene_type:complete